LEGQRCKYVTREGSCHGEKGRGYRGVEVLMADSRRRNSTVKIIFGKR